MTKIMPKFLNFLNNSNFINKFQTCIFTKSIFKDMKAIVLYFSSIKDAENVDHCNLLKKLIRLHSTALNRDIRLEVLFVPTDLSSVDASNCFIKHGNWYSLCHGQQAIFELIFTYEITSTPSIVVIKNDGQVISRTAANEIIEYGSNAICAWI